MSKSNVRSWIVRVAGPLAAVLSLVPGSARAEKPPEPDGRPLETGVAEEQRAEISAILAQRLLDEYALYTTTWNYHWNVRGIEFQQLHALFGEQYAALALMVDELAERVRALGFRPSVTREGYPDAAESNEEPAGNTEALSMLRNLASEHERIARTLREDARLIGRTYGDAATENMLLDAVLKHEKMAWMLRAHVEGYPASPAAVPSPL